ncbi:SidA/IucD/PvdA family monooxygenase [Pseudenhygromyxa sp. WMMC2535]|uniref:lysine N(6)-hydroxylase/L-ornithine N(5)-oxygenase family protein n=1 Tax=Pseudenhygromyxa sp. WMMC2535 TaxID=2712867 RepID=UPI001557CDEF|nr:SidA/IucD/PvdA family monooxygenase [Pseudenhygromyxa sp. WMMC2535]NVB36596.1 SidA/IucD/PvdA family monooxygenase [Pseudenhygromyxa sp. WMMC2535]
MTTLRDSNAPHDLLAIGCGPFNLGLAALASTVDELDFVALDASAELRWHRGLMFDDARLQVSFLADLVSMVDPTHPLSFLAYLADVDRMYPFYVRERFHMMRREYEDYLRWAIARLDNIRFQTVVERVEWDATRERFVLALRDAEGKASEVGARNLSVGIGTQGWVPDCVRSVDSKRWLHSGEYLDRLAEVTAAPRVTVIGSGQSGAEVMLDLLRRRPGPRTGISWLTRTCAFAPLDYTKLVLEMTTPEYVKYFHALPEATRDALVSSQWRHYKGISTDTLEDIHNELYRQAVEYGHPDVELRQTVAMREVHELPDGSLRLVCEHTETGVRFEHETDLLILATGYRHRQPDFLAPLESELVRDASGRLSLDLDHAVHTSAQIGGKIFVVNADIHTHGVAAPDLGICAYRNGRIINTVLGRERYRLPKRTAFTRFGTGDLAGAVRADLRGESAA